MKLRIPFILLSAFLLGISIVERKIPFLSLGILAVLLLLDSKIPDNYREFVYVLCALSFSPLILGLFLLYVPFLLFSFHFPHSSFILRYLFGVSIAIFTTLLIYTLDLAFGFSLHAFLIGALFLMPPLVLLIFQLKTRRLDASKLFSVDPTSFKVLVIGLFFLFFVGLGIVNSESLFMSNGSYFYSKYVAIVNGVESGSFPFYSPYSAQGEQLFLVDSPAFFSHLAFLKVFFPFADPVLFFNAYSLFLLFLTYLGISLVLLVIVEGREISPYLSAIGGAGVVFSFIFVQYLESVKQFFAHPIGFLIIALALLNPKKVWEIFLLGFLLVLALAIHPPQAVGILLFFSLIFFLMQFFEGSLFREKKEAFSELNYKKWIYAALLFGLLLIPLFYVLPVLHYSEFMRSHHVPFSSYLPDAKTYVAGFFSDESPLSLSYPDTNRLDMKKIGGFFSVLGLLCAFLVFALFKERSFARGRVLASAFVLMVIISSIAVSLPLINNMEYGYRALIPYLLFVLIASICLVINSFGNSLIRYGLLFVFVVGSVHGIYYAKENLLNIHRESFVSGSSFSEEILFLRSLPTDGRVITYGFYGNAVDSALPSLTGKYLSRYEFKQFDSAKMLYEKIHSSHSWGDPEYMMRFSDEEFGNYLRIGGYKYVLANICHPSGQVAVSKIYPNFAIPIFQSSSQCSVVFTINESNYAEKIHLVSKEDAHSKINLSDGYKYSFLSPDYSTYPSQITSSGSALGPVLMERVSDSKIILRGEFGEGDIVVFKEQYFPRWKASMDGKKVLVFSTGEYLIGIRTAEGDEIVLENRPSGIERIGGLLSSVGIVMFLMLLVFV